MEKKEIKIEISGIAGSGKSTVAMLISMTLIKHGFEIDYASIDPHTFKDTNELDNSIKLLPKNSRVTIREKQDKRKK